MAADSSSVAGSSQDNFYIGEGFKTFEELERKLKRYEVATSTKFWKRDSRTVSAARKRITRPLSDSIKYYQIHSTVFMVVESLWQKEKEAAQPCKEGGLGGGYYIHVT